jgi:hypothetical protein
MHPITTMAQDHLCNLSIFSFPSQVLNFRAVDPVARIHRLHCSRI